MSRIVLGKSDDKNIELDLDILLRTRLLGPAQQRILQALHREHPAALAREELAARAEASPTSSAFTNNLGALRSAGMIEYGPNSTVKCADWLFID